MWIDEKGQLRRGRHRKSKKYRNDTFEYQEKILETYLTDYIAEYNSAADLLGLSANSNISEKEINERYRNIISVIHPDKWANENDPELSQRLSDLFISFKDARDVLVKRKTVFTLTSSGQAGV